jgi:hypothetical protein
VKESAKRESYGGEMRDPSFCGVTNGILLLDGSQAMPTPPLPGKDRTKVKTLEWYSVGAWLH